jgi:NAD(P)-dependent dehydrogenase (short-subunit alcohol dehydrogenase family)
VAAADLVTVNFAGAVSVLLALARVMRRQGHGRIVVLSSVAGERVRPANMVYGSTKAGLDGFALALGDSLVSSGVSVLVVRPGFVRSAMTQGMDAAPFATRCRGRCDSEGLAGRPSHRVGARSPSLRVHGAEAPARAVMAAASSGLKPSPGGAGRPLQVGVHVPSGRGGTGTNTSTA